MRYDASTGLDWMSVRAYDPTIGRFLSRDPLGRVPLFFADNPYVYAGNNPLSNVDPSGQYRVAGFGSTQRESAQATNQHMAQVARMVSQRGKPASSPSGSSKRSGKPSLPAAVLSLLGACSACGALWQSLSADVNGVRLIGVILVFVGFLADMWSISQILKSAAESPDLAATLREAIDFLGSMERVMDFVSMMSNVFNTGLLAGMVHGLVAVINFLEATLKLGLRIALGGSMLAILIFRLGLIGVTETEDGEMAPIDVAISSLAGARLALLVSAGASALIAAGEGIITWDNFRS